MTSDAQDDERSPEKRERIDLEAGPFVLRTLLQDVPLSADGAKDDDVKINCVDYLDGNLYVGTSASELIHFVKLPPDPADKSGASTFVQASRLEPAYAEPPGSISSSKPGVQQILLLPRVGKACILCNWTVTFYSLPELSPVFNNTQVKNCNWIGGIDLNELSPDNYHVETAGVTILLSLNRRIQVVRIGEDARVIKKIDFPGSTLSIRRESIACVADSRNYALLEINRQLKIPLMSISSLDETQPGNVVGQAQDISASEGGGILRSASSAGTRSHAESSDSQVHRRGTSLGNLISGNRRQDQRPADQEEPVFQEPPEPTDSSRPPERVPSRENTPLPQAEGLGRPGVASRPSNRQVFLKPHIASPTPEEFLLVTGTGPLEPGIGMFVNLDGDPTRPTIEFDRYPKEIIVDGGVSDLSSSRPTLGEEEEGYVLAAMGREFEDGMHNGLEIQRWDTDGSQAEPTKHWLEPPNTDSQLIGPSQTLGIRSLLGVDETYFPDIVDRLRQQRFKPFSEGIDISTMSLKSMDSRTALSMEQMSKERELFERDNDSQDDDSLPEGWENKRNAEEEDFAQRLAGSTARLAVWSGSHIWWALRNPLILQLDAQLEAATSSNTKAALERRELFTVLNSFRGRDAKSELEFLTFNYIRQRAGILLLTSFLLQSDKHPFTEPEMRALEEVLVDSLLDPRVVLSLIPGVRNEVIETRRGIWIFGGVKVTAEDYIATDAFDRGRSGVNVLPPPVLQFLKRFLTAWRRKKGFGSIQDENEVFRTVDAALLAVLLELDQHSPPGLAKGKSVRAELYDLVDNGVDCFDRAETLIESYHRLFVLSRLYQSRKMVAEVLATWKRIVEGERDDGGEFRDGELRIREYLSKINSQAVVQEYGIWLANRNPKLGVQIFADEKGRAPKFEPTHVVEILREEAPDAVKYYLEYLVFGQGHTIYVNELITYYLDIVITHLQSSAEARDVFAATYAAYRALRPLKPTYRRFLTDNAPPDDEVWQSRLRLLQLLGGSYDYDLAAIRDRIAGLNVTAEDLLVPETIILDGRERKHEDALRLLVHRLGDYDTAVSYCIRGGASIYSIYQVAPLSPNPSAPENSKAPKRRESVPPTEDQQARLFRALLSEFLMIEDVSDRVEQTGMLLERFGGWFDVDEVLSMIPDNWSVDLVAGFLVRALRRMVVEKNETTVARALSSSQYLRVQHDLIVRVDEKGPTFEGE